MRQSNILDWLDSISSSAEPNAATSIPTDDSKLHKASRTARSSSTIPTTLCELSMVTIFAPPQATMLDNLFPFKIGINHPLGQSSHTLEGQHGPFGRKY